MTWSRSGGGAWRSPAAATVIVVLHAACLPVSGARFAVCTRLSARPEGVRRPARDDEDRGRRAAGGGCRVHARRRAGGLGARRADDRPRHRLPPAPADAAAAQDALVAAGFRAEAVPEEWLLKAWDGDVLIDLIFRPAGGPVGDADFARADELEVMAVRMPSRRPTTCSRRSCSRSPSRTPTSARARARAGAARADRLGGGAGEDVRVALRARRSSRWSRSSGSRRAGARRAVRLSSVLALGLVGGAVRRVQEVADRVGGEHRGDGARRPRALDRAEHEPRARPLADTFGHVSSWPAARRMPVPAGSSTRSPSSPTTVAVNGARSGAATLSFASCPTLCAATPASAMSTSDGRCGRRPVAPASTIPPPRIVVNAADQRRVARERALDLDAGLGRCFERCHRDRLPARPSG